jgi:hypothetical protein
MIIAALVCYILYLSFMGFSKEVLNNYSFWERFKQEAGGFFGFILFLIGTLVALGMGLAAWFECDYSKNQRLPTVCKLLPVFAGICFCLGILMYAGSMYHLDKMTFIFYSTMLSENFKDYFECKSLNRGPLMQGSFFSILYLVLYSFFLTKYDILKKKHEIINNPS